MSQLQQLITRLQELAPLQLDHNVPVGFTISLTGRLCVRFSLSGPVLVRTEEELLEYILDFKTPIHDNPKEN